MSWVQQDEVIGVRAEPRRPDGRNERIRIYFIYIVHRNAGVGPDRPFENYAWSAPNRM